MIQTVNGEIEPTELGITMSHEHLCIDLSRIRKNHDSTFGYEPVVINEIMQAKAYNVKTFVEVSSHDMGRNPIALQKLSKECDIHIIAATGCYLDEYHSDAIKAMSIDDIATMFITDLTKGMDGTSIKAGVIGEVASSEIMSASEQKVLRGAARAANSVGCAITTHCQMGKLGNEQADIFLQEHVRADKVILGHIDLSDDIDYMVELMEKGFNIGFDTIGKEQYLTDTKRAKNIVCLINKGYGDKLVLSQDISRTSYFHTTQGCLGYCSVMEKFIPMLRELGVQERKITNMLVDNPQRIFNIKK